MVGRSIGTTVKMDPSTSEICIHEAIAMKVGAVCSVPTGDHVIIIITSDNGLSKIFSSHSAVVKGSLRETFRNPAP